MSELKISYDQVQRPPDSCHSLPSHGSPDDCHLDLPLQDKSKFSVPSRLVRFDRVGDQFVLSPENTVDTKHWFESHQNTEEIAKTVRVAGILFQADVNFDSGATKVVTVMSNFIVTGDARYEDKINNQHDLARDLLNIFTDSQSRAIGAILGQLQIMRTSSLVAQNPQMLERILWITNILDHVSKYRDFRRHLIQESDLENLNSGPREKNERVQKIVNLASEIITTHATKRPLSYDSKTTEAFKAYQQLYGSRIEAGGMSDFCTALARGLGELSGRRGFGGNYVQQCREVTPLVDLMPLDAAIRSLSLDFDSPQGRERLQLMIGEESDEANMPLSWFHSEDGEARESYEAVTNNFLDHVKIELESEQESESKIYFDFPSFRQQLDLTLETHATTRREYILLGLAVLRRYFGVAGDPPDQRIFANNQFQSLSWQNTPQEIKNIRRYIKTLENQLRTSHHVSDTYLPILEGITCVVGVGGIVVAEAVPKVRDDETLHLAVGTPSAGLAGAGCTSLLMHYAGQPVLKYKNRHLWEGITAGVGLAAGVGLFLGLNLPLGEGPKPVEVEPPGPGSDRFPVDGFGN